MVDSWGLEPSLIDGRNLSVPTVCRSNRRLMAYPKPRTTARKLNGPFYICRSHCPGWFSLKWLLLTYMLLHHLAHNDWGYMLARCLGVLVENIGIEPIAFSLPVKRSTQVS